MQGHAVPTHVCGYGPSGRASRGLRCSGPRWAPGALGAHGRVGRLAVVCPLEEGLSRQKEVHFLGLLLS